MDILKQLQKFSLQMQVKRWADTTQENYLSQVKSFLYYFKDETNHKNF